MILLHHQAFSLCVCSQVCKAFLKTLPKPTLLRRSLYLICTFCLQVSLDKKLAYVKFDPTIITGDVIRDTIDDMGFEASFDSPDIKEVTISVEGMTCKSCVQNIEGVMGDFTGVKNIKVSLEDKTAKVQYDAAAVTPQALAERIDDMGFEAALALQSADEFRTKDSEQVTVDVDGMTCNSCVQTIESTMREKPGVNEIVVSLEKKQAKVDYDPGVMNPEKLREAIDDMGFEAKLNVESLAEFDPLAQVLKATVNVKGMTCNSCVENIEGNIAKKPGVISIKVSLKSANAVIEYDPSVTNPATLRDWIDDMGFEASLPQDENDEFARLARRNKDQTCTIDIEGMTCNSCVQNIEGNIGPKEGILAIKVALKENNAEVRYNPDMLTPEEIAEMIDDMGFEARVAGAHPPGGCDNATASATACMRAAIEVKGMHCNSCTRKIEGTVGDLNGMVNVKVNLMNEKAEVVFHPSEVSMKDILDMIRDGGFTPTLLGK